MATEVQNKSNVVDYLLQLPQEQQQESKEDEEVYKDQQLKLKENENSSQQTVENKPMMVTIESEIETIVYETDENSETSSSSPRPPIDYESWSKRTVYQPPYSDSEEDESSQKLVKNENNK